MTNEQNYYAIFQTDGHIMCTFADVNAEDKLHLALIRIAQLEDELKAQTSRPDWTAREKELNDRHARELYEQKPHHMNVRF